ncbi:protein of unknown function [Candidatus Nitrosocosmicus franklandus]|uniref:Uncharacterized protein n=1 Tax=Candidatus Nitrosocosmicus franklandianus TaxID=1798806 RepID=A0A484I422_9ARCH|nr:protein of unknown function [Candidatus Nitrosocosmicus franklandus]
MNYKIIRNDEKNDLCLYKCLYGYSVASLILEKKYKFLTITKSIPLSSDSRM